MTTAKKFHTRNLPPDTPGRLKELRTRAGKSVPEVAEAAGVSRAAVYYLEAGTTSPSWESICKLADYYGISTDVFRPQPAAG